MAIAYKSAGTGVATEADGGNLAPTCPAVVDANDILILHCYYEQDTVTQPTAPSGWTLIASAIVVDTVGRHWIYAKLADGTEDGTAISLGSPGYTTMRTARIYSFSGWLFGTIAQNIGTVTTTSHATDPQMPTVQTLQAGHLAIALIFQADDNGMASATGATGGTWTQRALYEQLATTPDSALALYDCTPTANPGTVSGGGIATANDPTGSIGFPIGYVNTAPTTTLNTPVDTAINQGVNQMLSFQATDTESDEVEYEVQVDTVNTFNSGNLIDVFSATNFGFTSGHPYPSGAETTYVIQTTLANNTTYYWRVRAIDPLGSNTYGAWTSYMTFTTEALAVVVTDIAINVGDAWKLMAGAQINIGDVWKTVVSVKQNVGDVWKDVL